MKDLKVGDVVEYVSEDGRAHNALVKQVFPFIDTDTGETQPPTINLCIIGSDGEPACHTSVPWHDRKLFKAEKTPEGTETGRKVRVVQSPPMWRNHPAL